MGAVRSVAAGLMSAMLMACGADSPVGAGPTGAPPDGGTPVPPTPQVPFMPRIYRVTDVMRFAYPDTAYGVRLNDRDEIIANIQDTGTTVFRTTPVIWRNGSTTTMPGCAWAYQINARGQVLCYTSPGVAFWQNGALTPVAGSDSLVTDNYYAAVANDSGDVAGSGRYCYGCTGTAYLVRAGRWSALDPPLPPVFFPFHIVRINNAGAVLVSDFRGGYSTDGYVVKDGQLVETFPVGIGDLSDMNDAGQIIGTYLPHPGNPVVLTEHVAGFPKLFGDGRSINNREQIVGQLIFPTYPNGDVGDPSATGPFYWTRLSGLLKLRNAATDSAWTITNALQINNAGAILAVGDNASLGIRNHLVLLVPVQ